jgi:hypothetical protein
MDIENGYTLTKPNVTILWQTSLEGFKAVADGIGAIQFDGKNLFRIEDCVSFGRLKHNLMVDFKDQTKTIKEMRIRYTESDEELENKYDEWQSKLVTEFGKSLQG